MSRALANGFIKVPKPGKAKPQRDESPLLSKAALRAQQQRSSTPRTPRKATQPTQSASKKRLAQARGKQKPASVAPTPKRDRPIQSLDPSPLPSRKRARHDDYADNPSPASKKRARKEAQEARQRQLLQEEDEDEGEAQVEEDLVLPFWADPLVELNARASQANRVENKYQDVYFGARIAMRFFGPSASPDRIISYAVAMHGVPADEHPCNMTDVPHPDDKIDLVYLALAFFFPNWENIVPILKKEPELIMKLGSYVFRESRRQDP
ncbi:hypothetical protein K466DRAFT_604001 [Polyporus arcularius HHB13444]|uniref:Uncharacterized protein n=1 Tax=Polyporus arcularius HHB13444 TaxID=1314778 RepID=A0A5C3P150_9APHY|nr:hypothetical protein K466DRAFT_604001 [Polyporus arcularius HHB13444]